MIVMLFCRAYVIAGSGLVAVIHVLVPLSVLLVVVVLAIFGILCAWEINKLIRTKRYYSAHINLCT